MQGIPRFTKIKEMQVIKTWSSSCRLLLEKPKPFQASQENNIDTYKSCVLMLRGLQLECGAKKRKSFLLYSNGYIIS